MRIYSEIILRVYSKTKMSWKLYVEKSIFGNHFSLSWIEIITWKHIYNSRFSYRVRKSVRYGFRKKRLSGRATMNIEEIEIRPRWFTARARYSRHGNMNETTRSTYTGSFTWGPGQPRRRMSMSHQGIPVVQARLGPARERERGILVPSHF